MAVQQVELVLGDDPWQLCQMLTDAPHQFRGSELVLDRCQRRGAL